MYFFLFMLVKNNISIWRQMLSTLAIMASGVLYDWCPISFNLSYATTMRNVNIMVVDYCLTTMLNLQFSYTVVCSP